MITRANGFGLLYTILCAAVRTLRSLHANSTYSRRTRCSVTLYITQVLVAVVAAVLAHVTQL
jgi:Trk-type K+ transport system membrane component